MPSELNTRQISSLIYM